MFEDYRPDLLTIHTSSIAENHANSIHFSNLFNAKKKYTINDDLKNHFIFYLAPLQKRDNNFILV